MDKAQAWAQKGAEAAREEATDLLLPSGMTIRARRPGPALLAAYGGLPMGLALTAASVNADAGEGGGAASQTIEVMDLMRELLLYCVVEPRISMTPGPGQIRPRDVPNQDVDFILYWAMRGSEAASLETFRSRRADGGAGGNGAGVPGATE